VLRLRSSVGCVVRVMEFHIAEACSHSYESLMMSGSASRKVAAMLWKIFGRYKYQGGLNMVVIGFVFTSAKKDVFCRAFVCSSVC